MIYALYNLYMMIICSKMSSSERKWLGILPGGGDTEAGPEDPSQKSLRGFSSMFCEDLCWLLR